MLDILLGMALFTGLVLILTVIILYVRSRLMLTGNASILINDERTVIAPVGEKLLGVLADARLYLPSACGGKGTCGQCKVKLLAGGGALMPAETSLLTKHEINDHLRLACQVAIKRDLRLLLPEQIFGVRKWECTVRSNRNIATFIKEVVLDLPGGESIDFRAGGYIQVTCPAYHARFRDFMIEDNYRQEWDRNDLWRLEAGTREAATRAYSMANYPGEKGIIMLDVRIATPPPGSDPETPPGIVSSYLFSLKPGDKVTISGPYGHFYARETENEMVFIGGGAGMAPIRSHILDQLLRIKTGRKITFWYGARSLREIFYREKFDSLQGNYENFSWHIALSDPRPEDQWTGYTGFIHQVAYDHYLKKHPEPEECEYYICGPPVMNAAVLKMLDDLGVEKENIMLDDFGG